MARKTAALRKAFQDCVNEEDIRAVVGELIARAKAGEPWAIRELLDRTLGKTAPALATVEDDPDSETSCTPIPAVLREFAAYLTTLPKGDMPSGLREWLNENEALATSPAQREITARINELGRIGLEAIRRDTGYTGDLPPGDVVTQTMFLLERTSKSNPHTPRLGCGDSELEHPVSSSDSELGLKSAAR